MKKSTKKTETANNDIIAEIEKRFGRHTNILMEQMKHEVKTVAEGHGIIIKKLEEHDKKFAKIDMELSSVKSELHTVKMAVMDTSQTVKSIEKKLDNHETRIKKVEEKIFV